MKKLIKISKILLVIIIIGFIAIKIFDPLPKVIRYMVTKEVLDYNIEKEKVFKVENIFVKSDEYQIPIRIYKPSDLSNLPVVYYILGGAFMSGKIDDNDNICSFLTNNLNAIIVSVDYRKAPENKFPVGLNDTQEVLNWIHNNIQDFGGDNSKIVLMGHSSGANFVVSLCQNNKKSPLSTSIMAQVLINPVLDFRESHLGYKDFKILFDMYLSDKKDSVNPLVSPLLAKEFSNLPTGIIMISENDYYKTDGVKYHSELKKNGIESNLYEIKNLGHLTGNWSSTSGETKEARDYLIKEVNNLFYE